MARTTRLLSLLAVLILLMAACGGEGDEADQPDSQTASNTEAVGGTPTPIVEETMALTGGEPANFHDEVDAGDMPSLEVELDDNYIEPTIVVGRAGQELTLELFNEGDNIHNFSIEAQDISQDLEKGGKHEVKVVFPDSGAVSFFCRYHAELGMRGELRVA